jgi:hypothetical protein
MKHFAAATDPCGRGSRAFVEEADPDEVVMAAAEPQPGFVRLMEAAGIEPASAVAPPERLQA